MKVEAFSAVWTDKPRRVVWTIPWKKHKKHDETYGGCKEDDREEIEGHGFQCLKLNVT